MPSLGLLSCSIELGDSNLRLREYGTTYHNRAVETFVAIPSQPSPFGICLNSHGFIAPGLSIWVFIDGVYQTNRNKRGLQPPSRDDPDSANAEFRVGQKEDLLRDGRVIARGWWFEKLNIVAADTAPTVNADVLNNLGTIEVVVLRCQDDPDNPTLNPWEFPILPSLKKSPSDGKNMRKDATKNMQKQKEPSNRGNDDNETGSLGGLFGLFDGATDEVPSDHPHGLDGNYDQDRRRSNRYEYTPPMRPIARPPSNNHRTNEKYRGDIPTQTSSDPGSDSEYVTEYKHVAENKKSSRPERHWNRRPSRLSGYYELERDNNRPQNSASQRDGYGREGLNSRDIYREELSRDDDLDFETIRYRESRGRRELEEANERTRILESRLRREEANRKRLAVLERELEKRREQGRPQTEQNFPVAPSRNDNKALSGSDYRHPQDPSQDDAFRYYSIPTERGQFYASHIPTPAPYWYSQLQHGLPQSLDGPLQPANPYIYHGPHNAQNWHPPPQVPPKTENVSPSLYTSWYGWIPPNNTLPVNIQQPNLTTISNTSHTPRQANGGSIVVPTAPYNHLQAQPPSYPLYWALQPPQSHLPDVPIPVALNSTNTGNQPHTNSGQIGVETKIQQLEQELHQLKITQSIHAKSGQEQGDSNAPGQMQGSETLRHNGNTSAGGNMPGSWPTSNPNKSSSFGGDNKKDDKNGQSGGTWGGNQGGVDESSKKNHPETNQASGGNISGGGNGWNQAGNTAGDNSNGSNGWVVDTSQNNPGAAGDGANNGWPNQANENNANNQQNENNSHNQQSNNDQNGQWNDGNQGNGWDNNNNQQQNQENSGSNGQWDTSGGGGGWDNNSNQQKNQENSGGGGSGWDNNHNQQNNKENSSGQGQWDSGGGGSGWDNTNTQVENNNSSNSTWKHQQQESGVGNSSKSTSKKKKSRKSKDDSVHKATRDEKPYTRSYWKSSGTVYEGLASANSGKKRGYHTMPEDPIYTIPESEAREKHVQHQVRGGKGAEQTKKTYKPIYWDDFDEPYAVFRFKYRSRDMLKEILGKDIKESPEELKEWLGALSKEQLIAEMMRKKNTGSWDSDGSSETGSKASTIKDGNSKGAEEGTIGGNNESWGNSGPANAMPPAASGGW